MCSIAGFCFTPNSHFNPTKLAAALLVAGENRGTDACGASWMASDGSITTKTRALDPRAFTKKGFHLPSDVRTCITHTRFATQGLPSNPLNNHPIERTTKDAQIVALVHNGVIDNDDALFADFGLERYAQVDSEILPALVADYRAGLVPEAFREVQGAYACGYLDERLPHTLTLLRGDSSPLCIAKIQISPRSNTPRSGMTGVVFASTRTMLEKGLAAIGLSLNSKGVTEYGLAEGQYMSVVAGTWDTLVYPFAVASRRSTRQWDSDFYGSDTTTTYPSVIGSGHKPTPADTSDEYLDNMLIHMEWCEPSFCAVGTPHSCPVNEREVTRYKRNATPKISEADIKAVVNAWTHQDRR